MRLLCPRCQTRYGDDVERCPKDDTPLRADPFIGTRIERWTLTGFVGQGAMGVVYAAEPTAAIKILNARRAAMQPDLMRRFEVEAAAASRFESPHIAKVLASGTTEDGHLFIAMELLRGEPLDAILKRSPRLPEAAAATIGYQLAGALGEAHAADVVHRDLKPANIFVEPALGGGRHIRLLDFGVARINSESVARSRTGSIAGTPAYMSPEQLRGEPDIDGRSDIYSLGVVLYQLLSGTNPFRGPGGVMGTLRRHLELVPPPIEGVSPILNQALDRMLAKHRDARPQTIDAVQQLIELTGLLGGSGNSITIPGMSREMLAAAGVYDAAPDPEEQPLPAPAEPAEAPQPPTPEAADPAEAQEPPPPTITGIGGRLIESPERPTSAGWVKWVIGLAALGVALGLGIVWSGIDDSTSIDADAAVHRLTVGAVDDPLDDGLRSILARAEAAMKAESWNEARKAYDEALERAPDHAEARAGRTRAMREAANQPRYDGLLKAMADERWGDAFSRLQEFPSASVYTSRAQARRPEIEDGYANMELERGRLFIRAREFDNARRVQKALARKDFAQEQAQTLAREIEEATSPQPGMRRPVETPESKPRRASKGRRTSTVANQSFDELVKLALRRTARGDRDAAIVLLRQAAKKRPKSQVPYQRLCAIYKAKEQYRQALSACKKWLEREPNTGYRPAIQRNIEQLQELLTASNGDP